MNRRFRRTILLSVASLAVAIATVTAVVASKDDGEGTPQTMDALAGACLEVAIECDDVPDDGSAAGGTCLEGATECEDIPADAGSAGSACLVGTPNCNDTPGLVREDAGN